MSLVFRDKVQENKGILSATRPAEPILQLHSNTNTNLKTILRQKKKIVIYIENKQYFVEHATAYALGFSSTRAIMLDKPKLVPISYDIHNKICNSEEYEIEYVTLENKKEKIRVFVDGASKCIEPSAAYALGLLSVDEFSTFKEKYYYITEGMLNSLKAKYDIEIYSLNLFEETKQRYK